MNPVYYEAQCNCGIGVQTVRSVLHWCLSPSLNFQQQQQGQVPPISPALFSLVDQSGLVPKEGMNE